MIYFALSFNLQQGELGEGGYEAWVLLGEVRGMDERESEGLVALQEGVNRGAPPEALLVSQHDSRLKPRH
jgi:hypothetical protein